MEILNKLAPEKQELALQFVMDKQNGFLPLNLTIQAIATLLPDNGKDRTLDAMKVYKYLNQ